MVNYGKVQSGVKPESIVIDDYSVWVNTEITEITENKGTDEEFNGYEYNQVQYTKDEYIKLQMEQITDTQVALCEVYELLS
jgi:hypothetical protein